MTKTVMKFTAVPYSIGTGASARTGYRPALVPQEPVADLDFCREIVNEKRLAMSPDELLHAMEMVGEVGPAKVAQDGRPRAITKLLKYNRFAQGNLESPTSPWNETCKARICAQLMWEADKLIDASFQNVNSGIGVRLNYVAWVGAQTVINVIKIGRTIGVYGNHMEFIAGDTAKLTVGTADYPLTCTESDVAHAVFSWPAGLSPEAGTTAEFVMKSRGGIEDGQVYTSRKTVTILAGDPPVKQTIAFSNAFAASENYGLQAANPEGLATYVAKGGTRTYDQITVNVKVNGTSAGTVELQRRDATDPTKFSFDDPQTWPAGATIEFSASRDPAKADLYEPATVSVTCTAG